MQYDVFISYSSVDQKIAEGVCAYLEQHGIRCFVAYRDIPRGVVWAAAIVDALENARMMLVLFSRHFNESRQVDREIELAAEQDIPILTFRLSDAAFTGAKKYYLKNLNWIDAFPNPEQCFGSLKNNVCLLLNIPSDGAKVSIQQTADRNIKEAAQYKKVDLGLSVCWAEHNIGASSPEKYGDYFAWGETEPKSNYTAETNKYYDKTKKTYIDIGKDISGTKYDVARAQWGGNWRMPRLEEIKELIDKCSWQWIELKGINGYKVTGPNGNSIFLPAAGYRGGTEVIGRGSDGYYWSGTLYEDSSYYAYLLYFGSGGHDWFYSIGNRGNGHTVRPVTDK